MEMVSNAGYSVVTPSEVIEAAPWPLATSAQQAECYARTVACILAKGKTISIYTDRRYAFGIVHDFVYGNFSCMEHCGSFPPMEIKLLMSPYSGILDAMVFSDALAVIKIPGHSKLDPWKLKEITLQIFLLRMLPFKASGAVTPLS